MKQSMKRLNISYVTENRNEKALVLQFELMIIWGVNYGSKRFKNF